MKKHHLIILGIQAVNTAIIAETLCKNNDTVVLISNTQSKEIDNSQFEQEPILFHNLQFEYKPIITEEPKKNKFFHKPRNNFRKR